MGVVFNKVGNGTGIENIGRAQQEAALAIIFEIIQQALEINSGIRFPTVKQVQAEIKAEVLLRFQVVILGLTQKKADDGVAAFVTLFVLRPEVFPAFLKAIVVNDFFRRLQPFLELTVLFVLNALLQLTCRDFFIRKAAVVLNRG